MNSVWQRNIIRGLFIIALQLLLLKRIDITFGDFNYIHFTIYSIIIVLLPYQMNRTGIVVIGFLLGIIVDIFYDSLGVHAAATTLIAYARYFILNLISPTEGYNKGGLTANNYGLPWFLTYLSIMVLLHLVTLYSIEAFSFVYLKEIILRSVFSFIASLFFITIGTLIFNPKY